MTNPDTQQSAPLTVTQALQQAIRHHQAGQVLDAERLYRSILQAQPDNPDANHNLGVLAVQVKQPAAGLPYFRAALSANPHQIQYLLSYANALALTGQTDSARELLLQGQQRGLQSSAIEELASRLSNCPQPSSIPPGNPNDKQAPNSSATTPVKPSKSVAAQRQKSKKPSTQEINSLIKLFSQGQYTEAEALARQMTLLFPRHGFGWKVLGAILNQLGRSAEALEPMQRATALLPTDAEAHTNLGVSLKELGRLDEAASCHRRALSINPISAEIHYNLGMTLYEAGKLSEAEACYRRALQIKPNLAEAHSNLGDTLKDMCRLDDAEICYRQALRIKPNLTAALLSLGHLCYVFDDLSQAVDLYKKTLNVAPANRGLNAAVNLAVLHYLDDDHDRCRNMLLASRPIMENNGLKRLNADVYWHYLDRLLSWHAQFSRQTTHPDTCSALFVIGESHSLSAHGLLVSYAGEQRRCVSEWVPGCKQWHLGNSDHNIYKRKFEAIMARLPLGSRVLLLIGEIDCRHNEGLLKAWKKHPDKTIDEIVQSTVDAYLRYVSAIADRYGHNLIIGGVPCTNIKLDPLPRAEVEQLLNLIDIFNNYLRQRALNSGFDFLDTYALTDNGNGKARAECYIDGFHLLPSTVIEAFGKHCLRAA